MERFWIKGVSCTKHMSKHYLGMSNVVCYVVVFPERKHLPIHFVIRFKCGKRGKSEERTSL